jgi:hypothetical protein
MKLLSVSFVVGMAVMAFVGCDKGPQLPKQAEVAGTVTLDGKPMDSGEVRFFVENEPPVTLPVTAGAFSGKVFVGNSRIDVVRDVDGPPHPMDPTQKMKVNSVDPKFMGPNSPFKHDVTAAGAKDLKFEVTSARR